MIDQQPHIDSPSLDDLPHATEASALNVTKREVLLWAACVVVATLLTFKVY